MGFQLMPWCDPRSRITDICRPFQSPFRRPPVQVSGNWHFALYIARSIGCCPSVVYLSRSPWKPSASFLKRVRSPLLHPFSCCVRRLINIPLATRNAPATRARSHARNSPSYLCRSRLNELILGSHREAFLFVVHLFFLLFPSPLGVRCSTRFH